MNYTEKQKTAITDQLEPISDRELYQRYDDSLDECFGGVMVAGFNYPTSVALKNTDPIAYRCGFSDWLDCEIGEIITDEIDGQYYDFKAAEDIADSVEDAE